MRIVTLFIVPSLRLGGAERQVVDLVNGLSDNFDIYLVTFEKELDQIEALNNKRIRFYNYPRQYKYDFSPALEIARIIRRNKISIIHCTLQISLLFGLFGRLLSRKNPKLIFALHTTLNRDLKDEILDRILYTPMMLACDKIITVCQSQRAFWSSKYPFLKNKFVAIHNGIDTDRYRDELSDHNKCELKKMLKIDPGFLTVGILGGFRPEKGHEYALRALGILLDRGVRMKLLLIGDGERRSHLESLSKKLSVSEWILWAGYQKDPRNYLSLCDMILVPSYAETFSLAILEALSMGKPVIATEVGGTSEVIENGTNGFLVKSRDANDMAEKLQLLIEDSELRKRLSSKARQSVEGKFALSAMIRDTEQLFYEMDSVNRAVPPTDGLS